MNGTFNSVYEWDSPFGPNGQVIAAYGFTYLKDPNDYTTTRSGIWALGRTEEGKLQAQRILYDAELLNGQIGEVSDADSLEELNVEGVSVIEFQNDLYVSVPGKGIYMMALSSADSFYGPVIEGADKKAIFRGGDSQNIYVDTPEGLEIWDHRATRAPVDGYWSTLQESALLTPDNYIPETIGFRDVITEPLRSEFIYLVSSEGHLLKLLNQRSDNNLELLEDLSVETVSNGKIELNRFSDYATDTDSTRLVADGVDENNNEVRVEVVLERMGMKIESVQLLEIADPIKVLSLNNLNSQNSAPSSQLKLLNSGAVVRMAGLENGYSYIQTQNDIHVYGKGTEVGVYATENQQQPVFTVNNGVLTMLYQGENGYEGVVFQQDFNQRYQFARFQAGDISQIRALSSGIWMKADGDWHSFSITELLNSDSIDFSLLPVSKLDMLSVKGSS